MLADITTTSPKPFFLTMIAGNNEEVEVNLDNKFRIELFLLNVLRHTNDTSMNSTVIQVILELSTGFVFSIPHEQVEFFLHS